MRTSRIRCVRSARRSRVAGSGTQIVGKRSWRSRSKDVEGVAPIGLRLTHDHRANLGGVADEPRMPETLYQGVEPDGVPGALNPNRHRSGQRGIERFDCRPLVPQVVLTHLTRLGVQHGYLLRARVQVASDNCHGVGLLSESAVAQGEHSNSARPFSLRELGYVEGQNLDHRDSGPASGRSRSVAELLR